MRLGENLRRAGGRIACAAIVAGAVIGCPTGALASVVPTTGDWEGIGPHGLPFSFALAHHNGHVIATDVVVGYPDSCPATARDASAFPLSKVVYAGPGSALKAPSSAGAAGASLSGHLPGTSSSLPTLVTGRFTSSQSAKFSSVTVDHLTCGWPKRTLTWKVRAARRVAVTDGTWNGVVSGTGFGGTLTLVVGGGGRVVSSFAGAFNCTGSNNQGKESVSAGAEFIHPDGTFLSPLQQIKIQGLTTTWKGTFSADHLSGSVLTYDPCTKLPVTASFSATPTS